MTAWSDLVAAGLLGTGRAPIPPFDRRHGRASGCALTGWTGVRSKRACWPPPRLPRPGAEPAQSPRPRRRRSHALRQPRNGPSVRPLQPRTWTACSMNRRSRPCCPNGWLPSPRRDVACLTLAARDAGPGLREGRPASVGPSGPWATRAAGWRRRTRIGRGCCCPRSGPPSSSVGRPRPFPIACILLRYDPRDRSGPRPRAGGLDLGAGAAARARGIPGRAMRST